MNLKGRWILVVDDDVDTCRNLSDILGDLGYEVRTANSGPAALELVRAQAFDVALLDFKMPGMDGLTLYREIKRISPATVAIMVTAYASNTTTDDARRVATWKVLSKPVDLSLLLPLVDEAIRQPLVLVVDDDQDLCQNLWDLFRDCNYRVSLAHSAAEARQRIGQREFNVVLLDLKLPEGNAHDVFATIRQANPETRTVLITGHRAELESLIEQVLTEGADAVCYKPFDIDQLLAMLGRFVAVRGKSA